MEFSSLVATLEECAMISVSLHDDDEINCSLAVRQARQTDSAQKDNIVFSKHFEGPVPFRILDILTQRDLRLRFRTFGNNIVAQSHSPWASGTIGTRSIVD